MDPDLFSSEVEALRAAQAVCERGDLLASAYRSALAVLTHQYELMLQQSRRLIRRSDRAEREMHDLNIKLNHLAEKLEYKATHDELTGLLNRRAIFEKAHAYQSRVQQAVILIDIDFFKRINDEYGHPVGDVVIQEMARRIARVIGDAGDVGRVGGEEFIVLLPGYTAETVTPLAEQLRTEITDSPFSILSCHQVTASFGVSTTMPPEKFDDAYARVDQALYVAKRKGRNRVFGLFPNNVKGAMLLHKAPLSQKERPGSDEDVGPFFKRSGIED